MGSSVQSEGFRASADVAKTVITLSTGAVAFTVTFLDKFTRHAAGAAIGAPTSLYVAWGLFGLAVLCALWTLMAITGTLIALDRAANKWPLNASQEQAAKGAGRNAQVPALAMLAAFLLAILAMIWTGAILAVA